MSDVVAKRGPTMINRHLIPATTIPTPFHVHVAQNSSMLLRGDVHVGAEINLLVLDSLLVGLGRSVVLVLAALVLEGVDASVGTSAERSVVVLGDLLVGLLGDTAGSA